MKLELIATSTFGLEACVKREIEALGYRIIQSENAKITYIGDERAIVKSNLWLRTADRVLIKMAEFMAYESDDLFQQVKAIPWEQWIPQDGKFIVTCSTVKSRLRSEPNNQKTAKKAMVELLMDAYQTNNLPETGAVYTVKVTLLKDRATITLDTTGEGLHKRGYRVESVEAPIKETLAAAMVQLSFYKKDRILVDPCCGSGTIPIEAAMIARNIAPGLNRKFVSETWDAIPAELWKEERKAAYEAIDYDTELHIYGSDILPSCIHACNVNAEAAGVDGDIQFNVMDVAKLDDTEVAGMRAGVIVTNPPYGERIGEQEAIQKIYKAFKAFCFKHPTWSLFMITSDKTAEQAVMERPADRRRKLYNGRIEVCYYQFHGMKVF